ncbi:hypothetical protein K1719_037847 [Acacia pycnantha]|nr:hypothetical protein K1719_046182 [Acacia pycnantha]KAI9080169.1 hypothetical protein K1719_037847 [Acacia pycnantha]
MGRAPCCDKANVKRGPWSPEEDTKLKEYIEKNGTGGNWIALPQKAGLKRCGKSCRLRWLNYLRPNIKHGEFSDDEDRIICTLYANIGSRWSIIAAQLPGRTDNDIKNYWNTKLKKKLMGLLPPSSNHQIRNKPPATLFHESSHLRNDHQNPPFTSSYRDFSSSYYYPSPSTISFTGLESTSVMPSTTNNFPYFQNQEASLVSPSMQYYYNMFGSEGSCSTSSDGSCSQISHGGRGDVKQDEMGFHLFHHQNFNNLSNGKGGFDHHHHELSNNNKFMPGGETSIINQWASSEKPSDQYFGQTPLLMEYGIEEIKQMISGHNNNNIEENKREEGMMYYYY